MQDAIAFVALGPNPAPLAELVWAARVVAFEEARSWYKVEFQDRALPDLRRALDDSVLEDLAIAEPRTPAGTPIADDTDPEHAAEYLEAVWRAAADAVALAGDRPVIFGVVGGRRRTVTVASSACFQLLARPGDLCLDVRVSDPRAEGAQAGFFFPEQRAQQLVDWRCDTPTGAGAFLAADVQVSLVDIVLPRLRRFVPDAATRSYAAALTATHVALDRFAPPRVVVNFTTAEIRVNDLPVKLTPGAFLIYAAVLVQRTRGAEGLGVCDAELLAEIVRRFEPTPAYKTLREGSRALLDGFLCDPQTDGYAEANAQQRSKAKRTIKQWLTAHLPEHAAALSPQTRGKPRSVLYVTVEPAQIELIGWP